MTQKRQGFRLFTGRTCALDGFIKQGFTDSFRHLNEDPHHYSWWSYRANARANNKGWRIDYAMVSEPLTKHIEERLSYPKLSILTTVLLASL